MGEKTDTTDRTENTTKSQSIDLKWETLQFTPCILLTKSTHSHSILIEDRNNIIRNTSPILQLQQTTETREGRHCVAPGSNYGYNEKVISYIYFYQAKHTSTHHLENVTNNVRLLPKGIYTGFCQQITTAGPLADDTFTNVALALSVREAGRGDNYYNRGDPIILLPADELKSHARSRAKQKHCRAWELRLQGNVLWCPRVVRLKVCWRRVSTAFSTVVDMRLVER